MVIKHIIVEGRVQGVFFRDFTRNQATQLQLTGWVQNLPDGSVEALVCGPEKTVQKMIDWFWVGSPHAEVSHVQVKNSTTTDTFNSFNILY